MEKKNVIKTVVFMILGCLGVGLGAIGAVVPMIPTVPFLMMSAVCFGKSSRKLDQWFKETKLYKDNLESFVRGQGMTWKAKLRIMITVTLVMGIGFVMMFRKAVYVPCVILGVVWLFHIIYFCLGVKKFDAKENCISKEKAGVL